MHTFSSKPDGGKIDENCQKMKQRKCKTHKSTETASDGING
jgi:hypothetical protein